MSEIGVAVVGYGGMGEHHCNLVQKSKGLRLQLVCDSDPESCSKAKTALGVETCTCMEAVLDDKAVDLVVLVTPHHTHAPLTIQALSAGRHVVVEKAMCLNVKEVDDMIAAAEKAGRSLTIFHNRRFDSDFLTAQEVLKSGVLGDIYRIEAALNFRGPHTGWRTKMKFGGGYLYDGAAHLADQLVLMANSRVKTVLADLQKRVWTETMDTETYANVNVRFENGLVGELDISGIMWYRKPRFVIMGEKGSFVALAHENFGQADSFIYTEKVGWPVKIDVPAVKPRTFMEVAMEFYQQVARHLTDGESVPVDPREIRETIKIIQAAYSSAERGQSVEVLSW
jgi:scyllo-inositol 2-dehydrogenase (NADP+)